MVRPLVLLLLLSAAARAEIRPEAFHSLPGRIRAIRAEDLTVLTPYTIVTGMGAVSPLGEHM